MQLHTVLHSRLPPSATSSMLVALVAHGYEADRSRVALPSPEVQIVARFGPVARHGLDVHVLGPRETVHRKLIRGGQWALLARLRLCAAETVLGVPASRIARDHTPLEDFWGNAATARLTDQLAAAQGRGEAAIVLDHTIRDRARAPKRDAGRALVLAAAERLTHASVNAVARELGVSERHLRRVFREAVGVSPKVFASLSRFRRAIRAAHESGNASWAAIAATAGYYDQAHLIAEFRAIAGVTPRVLLHELDEVVD